MKIKKILGFGAIGLLVSILILKVFWFFYFFKDISKFMDENNLDTAVVAISQDVRDIPIWSKDTRFIYSEIGEVWYKFDLEYFYGTLGELRGQEIAIPIAVKHEEVDKSEPEALRALQKFDQKKIITQSSTTIEFSQKDLSTEMIVTKKDSQPKIVWETDTDSCHDLSLSPDEKLVAFICDKSGLTVFRTDFTWNYEDYNIPANSKKEVIRNPSNGVSKVEKTTYGDGHTYTKIILDGDQNIDQQWAEVSKHLK